MNTKKSLIIVAAAVSLHGNPAGHAGESSSRAIANNIQEISQSLLANQGNYQAYNISDNMTVYIGSDKQKKLFDTREIRQNLYTISLLNTQLAVQGYIFNAEKGLFKFDIENIGTQYWLLANGEFRRISDMTEVQKLLPGNK